MEVVIEHYSSVVGCLRIKFDEIEITNNKREPAIHSFMRRCHVQIYYYNTCIQYYLLRLALRAP